MLEGITGYGDTLKQALQASRMTHEEVSHNLANVDTPGFHSKETDFKQILLNSLDPAAPPHGHAFEAYQDEVARERPGVNVERELARLSRTSLEQAALVTLLNRRYAELTQAMTEGRKG